VRRIALPLGLVAVVVLAVGTVQILAGLLSSGPAPVGDVDLPGLTTYEDDSIAFDYPDTWGLRTPRTDGMFASTAVYVGTATVRESCRFFANGVECNGAPFDLAPGQVVISVLQPRRPLTLGTFLDRPLDGGHREVVGGMPAIRHDRGRSPSTSADRVIAWEIAIPRSTHGTYDITAFAREPNAALSLAISEALVRGFRFKPPVEPLRNDPVAALEAAASAIAHLTRDQPDFACFQPVPGAAAAGVIRREPSGPALQKPFSVTCETRVAPTVLQLWRVDLMYHWLAGPTYPAGRNVSTIWVDPEGTVVGGQGGDDPLPVAIVAPDPGT